MMISSRKIEAMVGDQVGLNCYGKVTGWMFNSSDLPNNAHINAGGQLRINYVNLDNDGFYECTGKYTSYGSREYRAMALLIVRGMYFKDFL